MNETVFSQLWDLVGGAFRLSGDAFREIAAFPDGLLAALLVVVLAGLSLSVGQSIVLFVNRVKPLRFFFSLLINAVLFTFGFIFLVLSTWFICLFSRSVNVSFLPLTKVLGLSYAPLLFSFLGALPYLGYPILNLLSVWRLLALVVGFGAIANVGTGTAFGYVAFGWFALQVLENTIGQPIAQLGKAIADRVAGVELVKNRRELNTIVKTSFAQQASPIVPAHAGSGAVAQEINRMMQASGRVEHEAAQAVAQTVAAGSAATTTVNIRETIDTSNPLVRLDQTTRSIPPQIKLIISLLTMAMIFILVMILLRPIRNTFFGWYDNLTGLFRLIFDLVWIGVVAIVFAGILAPLETLGWWAGWYGDKLETDEAGLDTSAAGVAPTPGNNTVSRYAMYLDGIGQSGEEYTPDVEDFLTALRPALPENMEFVSGLMMYSVLNKPLDEDRPLAFVWRLADKMRWSNPAAILGLMLNLRNVFIVAVSADKRYGPIYNQGIAQVLYNGLVKRGYQPGSGVPITLIGYSGGGQMSVAAAPYLRQAIGAPIDVISLGGVMSANNNFLKLEQLYHVVGDKDFVERVGPVMFPGRWKIFPLSYWNRAKRRGNVTIISAGSVGHQVPGGYMDPKATLPDGKTNLQYTIELILNILRGNLMEVDETFPRKLSNYARYQELAWVRPENYPVQQTVNRDLYRPLHDWMGRLILPRLEERDRVRGTLIEIYHAPDRHQHLVGQVVNLRWVNTPYIQQLVTAITKDVHFSADAEHGSKYGGLVHPDRLNHWKQVNPLESLAGSRPTDDMIVWLNDPVEVEEAPSGEVSLYIQSQPVQVTGRYYAVVQFLQPTPQTDEFMVVHFNRTTLRFDGPREMVRMPQVALAEDYGSYPSTTRDIEKSPLNEMGWYIFGARDTSGKFVVQSLAPRSLLQLQPQEVVFGKKASYNYVRKRSWANPVAQKGRISSVLCTPRSNESTSAIQEAIADWKEGDKALLIHTYGGIGGKNREPSAATPIFFGHFAYGMGEVVRDPLTDELRFDLRYCQVYTHNTDGLVAGVLHWSRYMGDRQMGWAGTRPVCDILIKLDCFTGTYEVDGRQVSPFDLMLRQLQVMTSRYRIGDGTGGTFVGPANNCSQDSNQALFASIQQTSRAVRENPDFIQRLTSASPDQARRFNQLLRLGEDLRRELQPLGGPRTDWEKNEYNLGSTLEDNPLQNLWTGIGSWRTMFPRLASDTIVRTFLKYGATVWVLRTNQIGGYDPDIEPIAPNTI